MANREAIDHPRMPAGLPQQARDAVLLLLTTAGSAVIYHTAAEPSTVEDPACALVAFLLFLLGVWLVLLALVLNHARMPPAGLLQQARALADGGHGARRVRLSMVNSGLLLIATSGSAVIDCTAAEPSAVEDLAYALVAFVLFLLGVWLALLALVADQFPRATRVGAAIARALGEYFFGGN